MARKLIVEIVGDASSLHKSYASAAKSTKQFEQGVERATRGAVAGTAVFKGLGRSLAFASGGFLAFAGVTTFLRESVDAAREAAVSQRSLAAQMKASGESFQQNRELIDQTSLAYGKFGFQNDEVVASLTVLERATGKVQAAIALQGVTADLARAKNMGLADAAAVIGKVFGGQETALRRAVPGLAKNAHGLDLIREASRKLAGQAAANTTATERFSAVLHDTQEIIGNALLPTINSLLDRFSKWLERMNRSGQLQQRVASTAQAINRAFRTLSGLIKTITDGLGGWQNALTVLVGAWAGFKAAGVASAIAVSTANLVAAGVTADAWKAALISTGWGAFAVAAGIAATYVIFHWEKVKSWFQSFWLWLQETADKTVLAIIEPFTHLPGFLDKMFGHIGSGARKLKDELKADIAAIEQLSAAAAAAGSGKQPGKPGAPRIPTGIPSGSFAGVTIPGSGSGSPKGFTLPYRYQLEQAQAEASGVQARIVQAARDIVAFLHRVMPKLKGQKLLDAYGLLAQANDTIRTAAEAAAQKARDAARKAREAAKAAAERLKQFDVPIGLQIAQARLEALGKSIRPVLLKIKAAAEKAIRSGRLGAQGYLDAWNTIAQVNDELKRNAKKAVDQTRFVKTNATAIINAVGGTPAQQRRMREVFSTLGPGGLVPSPSGQYMAAGIIVNGDIHVHNVQDVNRLEQEIAKRAKQRPHVRRGAR